MDGGDEHAAGALHNWRACHQPTLRIRAYGTGLRRLISTPDGPIRTFAPHV
jgi:hypothetical protein